jgi:hypothetical protein
MNMPEVPASNFDGMPASKDTAALPRKSSGHFELRLLSDSSWRLFLIGRCVLFHSFIYYLNRIVKKLAISDGLVNSVVELFVRIKILSWGFPSILSL